MDAGPAGSLLIRHCASNRWISASIRVLGTPVACATYDSALERIKALAREPRATAVCPSNTHILGEARHNPEFARVLASFDLVLPDGMPVVWALNFRGAGLKDRVYGPYFMRHALRNTPRPWRHFFFGDSEECLVELRRVLIQLQPDIEIVGMMSPPFRPFTEADETLFADTINRADPDFVWVALPGVRMEQWIIDNQARYPQGRVPCGGRCVYAAERPPLVRSGVDATDGADLGIPASQGAAPAGPALPAISLDVRILLALGRSARAVLERGPSENLSCRRIFERHCDERAGDQWHFTGRGCAPISCGPARGGNDADRTAIGFRNAATTADVATGSSSMGSWPSFSKISTLAPLMSFWNRKASDTGTHRSCAPHRMSVATAEAPEWCSIEWLLGAGAQQGGFAVAWKALQLGSTLHTIGCYHRGVGIGLRESFRRTHRSGLKWMPISPTIGRRASLVGHAASRLSPAAHRSE